MRKNLCDFAWIQCGHWAENKVGVHAIRETPCRSPRKLEIESHRLDRACQLQASFPFRWSVSLDIASLPSRLRRFNNCFLFR